MRYLPVLLALLTIGADPAPSPVPVTGTQAQSVPALTEPSWSFQDAGNFYFVGKVTGSVTIVRSVQPTPAPPAPTPNPRPVPPPVPPAPEPTPRPSPQVWKVAFATLIVDPASAEQASYRTDPSVRESLQKAGIQYLTYGSNESDIETLQLRDLVSQKGLPLLVLQDKDGKVLHASVPPSLAELRIACSRLGPIDPAAFEGTNQ